MSGVELFAIPALLGGGTATLGTAAGAASLAAGALAGVQASRQQASAQQQQADVVRENAQAQRQAGHNSIMEAEATAAREQDAGRRQRATYFNTRSGMGVDAATGSSGDVLDDMAGGSALDAEIARWRGFQENTARVRQSGLLDQQAAGLDAGARATRKAGAWQAAGTVLTGGRALFASAGADSMTATKAWRSLAAPRVARPN